MNTMSYPLPQRLVQKVASSKPGAWMLSKTQHHVDRLVLNLTGNRATLTSLVAGLPIVWLTSTGAKSGLQRTLPLLCIRDPESPERFALIATNWGGHKAPAWYHNLKANPLATCAFGRDAQQYEAAEIEGSEYDRIWQAAVDVYVGFPLYRQRIGKERHIPIMMMTPIDLEA